MIISLKDGTTKKKKFIIKIDKIAFLSIIMKNSLNKVYIKLLKNDLSSLILRY